MDDFTIIAWQVLALALGVLLLVGAESWVYIIWLVLMVIVESRHSAQQG